MDSQNKVSEIRNIIEDYINPATGDILIGAAGMISKLTLGSANQRLFVNAAGTGLEYGFGSKVVAYTRDMTLDSGDVSLTGAGFKPRSIIVLARYDLSLSIGFGDIADSDWFIGIRGTGLSYPHYAASYVGFLVEDAALTKYQIIHLKSMNADGCTVTFTKIGTPAAGTGNFIIMYKR